MGRASHRPRIRHVLAALALASLLKMALPARVVEGESGRRPGGAVQSLHDQGGAGLDKAAPCCNVLSAMREHLTEDLLGHVFDLVRFRYRIATYRSTSALITLWGRRGVVSSLHGHSYGIAGMEFFPHGDRLLTWSGDGLAVVWSADVGTVLLERTHLSGVKCARVFPKGDRVVTCSVEDGCVVWGAHTGKEAAVLRTFAASQVLVDPCGRHVLTVHPGESVSVWDSRSGVKRCDFSGNMPHAVGVTQIFPSGDKVITGGADNRAIAWDLHTCVWLQVFLHSSRVLDVAIVGSGDRVATTGSDGWVYVWNATSASGLQAISGEIPLLIRTSFNNVEPLRGKGDEIVNLAWGGARVLNASSGTVLHRFGRDVQVTTAMRIAPGGDMLATLGASNISVWDTRSGALLRRFVADDAISIAVGIGGLLDPEGFGPGLSWRQLPAGL